MLRNAVATCMALCAAASPVCAQDIEVGGRYRQSPQVLAHYPDIAVRLSTPATRRGRTTFTSDEEIENYFVKVFQLLGQPVVAKPLGQSGAGRSMLAYYFTAEGLDNLREIRALGRPIVWLIGQQHGNEPAGSEALLQIISDLIDGDLRPLLDKLSIVIVPRANPDGAAANTRDTGAGHDMNRDHIALTLPETRNIHRAVQELPPDLVIDAHEFSVAARWLEKFGGLQAVDLMLLSATHPMVPDPTRELAETVFEPAIKAAAQSHGLTTYAYVTTNSRRDDLAASMGGNAAGIARNAFGLTGAVSILLETRGVGIGMEGFRRRVATHVVAISGALRAAADHADKLKSTVAESRRAIAADRRDLVVAHKVTSSTQAMPLIDPATGETRSIDIALTNSRAITVTQHRPRPLAYVLLPEAVDAISAAALTGARSCRIESALEIDVEVFLVTDKGRANRRAINPEASVKGEFQRRRLMLPKDSIVIPTDQAAGHLVAAALEPDAPGGLLGADVIKMAAGATTAPVLRVVGALRFESGDGGACVLR